MANLVLKNTSGTDSNLTLSSANGDNWILQNYNNGETFNIFPSSSKVAYFLINKSGDGYIKKSFTIDEGWLFSKSGLYSGKNKDTSTGLLILSADDVHYDAVGVGTSGGDTYNKGLLKTICTRNSNPPLSTNIIGRYWPNSYGFLYGNIYSTGTTNSEGLPQYSTFFASNLGGSPMIFGTSDYNYYSYNIIHNGNFNSYGSSLASGNWNINAATATKLRTSKSIFGKAFDGSGNVAGQGLFYGTYGDIGARYVTSGLQIRENDLVAGSQSDIGYAPSIGFHWQGRVGGTLNLGSDGVFYLRTTGGGSRAYLDTQVPVADSLSSKGYGTNCLTYFQTSGDFAGNSGWSHYLIFNHGDGSSYYNVTVAFPFWAGTGSAPMYRKKNGGNDFPWRYFYTTENTYVSSTAPGTGDFYGQIWYKI